MSLRWSLFIFDNPCPGFAVGIQEILESHDPAIRSRVVCAERWAAQGTLLRDQGRSNDDDDGNDA